MKFNNQIPHVFVVSLERCYSQTTAELKPQDLFPLKVQTGTKGTADCLQVSNIQLGPSNIQNSHPISLLQFKISKFSLLLILQGNHTKTNTIHTILLT